MRWKVYNIQTGQTITAGFENEEGAKDWLEEHRPGREDNYMYEEMDEDEEQEWLDSHNKDDGDNDKKVRDWTELEDEEAFERGRYTYKTEDDDDDENAPDGLLYDEENDEEDDDSFS